MALNALGRLEVVFRFRDQSRPGTQSAAANINKVKNTAVTASKTMRNAFMGAFPAFLTVNIIQTAARAIGALIKPSMELTDALRRMEAFADLGGKKFSEFKKEAVTDLRTIGATLGYFTADLVSAFTEISKKGIEGEAGLAAMVPTARLARLAEIELNEALEVSVTLFKVWGFEGEELARRMDQLAFVARKGRLNFNELMDVITRSATGVAVAKPQFEDFLFVLTHTRDISQSAAVTGTQLRRSYERLLIKSKELGAALGVPLKNLGTDGYRHLTDILFDVAKNAKTLTEAQEKLKGALEAVGVRAAVPYISVMEQARKVIEESGGDAEKAYKKFQKLKDETLSASQELKKMTDIIRKDNPALEFDILRSSVSMFFEEVGPVLTGPLLDYMQDIGGAFRHMAAGVESLNEWMEEGGFWANTFLGLGYAVGFAARYFGILFAAMGLSKAGMFLFKAATGFSVQGIKQKIAALSILDVKLRQSGVELMTAAAKGHATGFSFIAAGGKAMWFSRALTVLGMKARWASVGIGWLAKSFKFLWAALGPVGIIATVIMTLMEFTDWFGKDIEDLDKMMSRHSTGSEKRIRDLRDAGDTLGASILAASVRLGELFGEKTPVIKESDAEKIVEMMGKGLARLTPEQQAQFGGAITSQAQEMQDIFKLWKSLGEGKVRGQMLSQEDLSALMSAASSMQLLKAMGEGDKQITDYTKRMTSFIKLIRAQIEGKQELTKKLGDITEVQSRKEGRTDIGFTDPMKKQLAYEAAVAAEAEKKRVRDEERRKERNILTGIPGASSLGLGYVPKRHREEMGYVSHYRRTEGRGGLGKEEDQQPVAAKIDKLITVTKETNKQAQKTNQLLAGTINTKVDGIGPAMAEETEGIKTDTPALYYDWQ